METKSLVLKFEEKEDLYTFDKKVNKVNNPKLVKILVRENVKNSNSSLIIKSMNLAIFDVIQFKINVSEVGSFLFNFEKEKLNDELRQEILNKITELHDNIEPSKEVQTNKVKKLINIVASYEEIYCSYIPNGNFKLTAEELDSALSDIELNFPILVLDVKEESIFSVENSKVKFKKFTIDYLFTSVFSLLMSFGVLSGIYQIFNKQSVAAFLLVLAFIFFGILTYSIYSVNYYKGVEKNKFLKYFLLIYTTIGCALGSIIGFFVCKYAIKTEVEELNMTNIVLISIGVSFVLTIASIYVQKLINLIVKKI